MKNLIFLCIATCIFILSMIVLNVAPIINGLLGKGTYNSNGEATSDGWYDKNCELYNDNYNIKKKLSLEDLEEAGITQEKQNEYIEYLKEGRNKCYRNKAMAGLEHAAFNFNLVFGLISAILGLLKYYGNNLGKSVTLIWIISGIIEFVLTFVYLIYSGIIFTQDVANKNYDEFDDIYKDALIKVDSESAHLKWDDSKGGYVCIFYNKDKKDSVYLKYSDYGNKYLNYNKDIYFIEESKDYKYFLSQGLGFIVGCTIDSRSDNFWDEYKTYDEGHPYSNVKLQIRDESRNIVGEYDKLYLVLNSNSNTRKNLYDQWLTTIILGVFISLLDIGLTIFGFLLLLDSNNK